MAAHRFTAAVITGAGSGLGQALAVELARRGASVALGDVNLEGLAETVQQVEALGGTAISRACDVRNPEEVSTLFKAAEEAIGPVDLMVNNAGVAVSGDVGDVPLDDWSWCIDVNLRGVVHGCHVAAPVFRERRRGVILNVASAAGLISSPGMAPYNATKSAVVALSQTMHAEMQADGVSVTVLCPTFFKTNLLDTARAVDSSAMKIAGKLMKRSSIQAPDVARIALDDAAAGKPYSVPMADGRFMWRLFRVAPATFYKNFGRVMRLVQQQRR